jgi:hypothetical protein
MHGHMNVKKYNLWSSHNGEIAERRISQNVSPSLSDAYLHLCGLEWTVLAPTIISSRLSRRQPDEFTEVSKVMDTTLFVCVLRRFVTVPDATKRIEFRKCSFFHY